MRLLSTRRHFVTFGLCAALLLTACGGLRAAKAPLSTTLEKSTCTPNADTLIVMLPGAYSHPSEFVREGFVNALNENRLAVDVMLVDAHLGYYNDKTILDRLSQDVMAPARSKGYKSIWVVGISVGGFGGLLYAQTHPGELAGLVTLAPYLGERSLGTDIANAGGLARWAGPLNDPPGSTPSETQLWQWLRGYVGRHRHIRRAAAALSRLRDRRPLRLQPSTAGDCTARRPRLHDRRRARLARVDAALAPHAAHASPARLPRLRLRLQFGRRRSSLPSASSVST